MPEGAALPMSEVAANPDCQRLRKFCDRLVKKTRGIDRVDPTYPVKEHRFKQHFRIIGKLPNGYLVKIHLGHIVQYLTIKTSLSRKTLCEYLNAEWDAAIGK